MSNLFNLTLILYIKRGWRYSAEGGEWEGNEREN